MSAVDVLRTKPEFATLTSDELNALVELVEERTYAAGATVITEGKRGDEIYLVLDGTLQVTLERKASRVELNQMRRGDLVGLVALVDDEPRSASCRTLTAATVAVWPITVARFLYNQRAAIARAFQLALSNQLARDFRQLDQRLRAQLRS